MMLLNNKSKVKKRKEKKLKKTGRVNAKISNPADPAPENFDDSGLSDFDPSEVEIIETKDFKCEPDEPLKADIADDRMNYLLFVNSLKRKNEKKKGTKGKMVDPNRNCSQDGKLLPKISSDKTCTTSIDVSQKVNLETQASKKKKKKKDGGKNGKIGPHSKTIATDSSKVDKIKMPASSDISREVNLETQSPKKKKNKKKKDGTLSTAVGPNSAKVSDSRVVNLASQSTISRKNGKLKKSVSERKKDGSNMEISVAAEHKKLGKKRKIAEIFEEAQICMEEAVPKKIDEVRRILMKGTESAVVAGTREQVVPKERPSYEDLSFKKSRVDVDTSLLETTDEGISSGLTSTQKILDKVDRVALPRETKLPDIDPNKFIPVKTQKLRTALPEFEEGGDSESEEEEEQQRMNLMEAFADDDIADEFRKEKEEAEEESKPKTVDLRLPGWGSWGGIGIERSKKKWNSRQNKHLLRFPGAPRKDQGKKYVIVNDDPPASFRKQQVDDLPSEFPSVAAYEASIRAPIGSTWVPQAAHHALTAAPVVTKMGAIIRPLDESHLVQETAEKEARKKLNDSIKRGKPAGRSKQKAGKRAGYSKPEVGGLKKKFTPAKKRKGDIKTK